LHLTQPEAKAVKQPLRKEKPFSVINALGRDIARMSGGIGGMAPQDAGDFWVEWAEANDATTVATRLYERAVEKIMTGGRFDPGKLRAVWDQVFGVGAAEQTLDLAESVGPTVPYEQQVLIGLQAMIESRDEGSQLLEYARTDPVGPEAEAVTMAERVITQLARPAETPAEAKPKAAPQEQAPPEGALPEAQPKIKVTGVIGPYERHATIDGNDYVVRNKKDGTISYVALRKRSDGKIPEATRVRALLVGRNWADLHLTQPEAKPKAAPQEQAPPEGALPSVIIPGKMVIGDGRMVDATAGQSKGLELMDMADAQPGTTVVIRGYAGTGKTSVLREFLRRLRLRHYAHGTWVATPTHAAAGVARMLSAWWSKNFKFRADKSVRNKPAADTTARILGSRGDDRPMVRGRPDTRFKQYGKNWYMTPAAALKDRFAPDIASARILIVDESSMLLDGELALIQEWQAVTGLSVIFMGDPAQLAQVRGKHSRKGHDAPDIGRTMDEGFAEHEIELTEVMRQADDNPLISVLTSLRAAIFNPNKAEASRALSAIPQMDAVDESGEGYVTVSSGTSAFNSLKESITTELFTRDPMAFRVYTPTNKSVYEWNRLLYEYLFPESTREVEPGALLRAYTNYYGPAVRDSERAERLAGHLQLGARYMNSGDFVVRTVGELQDLGGPVQEFAKLRGRFVEITAAVPGEVLGEAVSNRIFLLDSSNEHAQLIKFNAMTKQIEQQIDQAAQEARSGKGYQWGTVYGLRNMLHVARSGIVSFTTLTSSGKTSKEEKTGSKGTVKAFDLGYASTIHKGQGQTNQISLVDVGLIQKGAAFGTYGQLQLAYVGLSRASKTSVAILPTAQQSMHADTAASLRTVLDNANTDAKPPALVEDSSAYGSLAPDPFASTGLSASVSETREQASDALRVNLSASVAAGVPYTAWDKELVQVLEDAFGFQVIRKPLEQGTAAELYMLEKELVLDPDQNASDTVPRALATALAILHSGGQRRGAMNYFEGPVPAEALGSIDAHADEYLVNVESRLEAYAAALKSRESMHADSWLRKLIDTRDAEHTVTDAYRQELDAQRQLKETVGARTYAAALQAFPALGTLLDVTAEAGYILTGSLQARRFGTMYRSEDELVHDLDVIRFAPEGATGAQMDADALDNAAQLAQMLAASGAVHGFVYGFEDRMYEKDADNPPTRDELHVGIRSSTPVGAQVQVAFGVLVDMPNGQRDWVTMDTFVTAPYPTFARNYSTGSAAFAHKLLFGRAKDVADWIMYQPDAAARRNVELRGAAPQNVTLSASVVPASVEQLNAEFGTNYDVAVTMGLDIDSNQQSPDAARRILEAALRTYNQNGSNAISLFLENVLNSPDLRLPSVYLHRHQWYIPGRESEDAAGVSDGIDIDFAMSAFKSDRDAARVITHEVLHVLTLDELRANADFYNRMVSLYRVAKEVASSRGQDYNSPGMYGLKNVDEFIAEAFTNARFQQFLLSVPTTRTPSRSSSGWSEFRALVRRVVSSKMGADERGTDMSLLDVVLDGALEVAEGTLRRYSDSAAADRFGMDYDVFPASLSASVYQARSPKELMYRLTRRIGVTNRGANKQGYDEGRTLRTRWKKLEDALTAAETVADVQEIIDFAQSGDMGISVRLRDHDARTILIWAQKHLPLGMHPRDAIAQRAPGQEEDTRVFNDRAEAAKHAPTPRGEQLDFEDKLRLSASIAYVGTYFSSLYGGMNPVGEVGVRTSLEDYSRAIGSVLDPLYYRVRWLTDYWGLSTLEGKIKKMTAEGRRTVQGSVATLGEGGWLSDEERNDASYVLHAVQLVLDNLDSLAVRKKEKKVGDVIQEAINISRFFLPAELTPKAADLYKVKTEEDMRALVEAKFGEIMTSQMVTAVSEYLYAQAQQAESLAKFHEAVYTQQKQEEGAPKAKTILRVPVDVADMVWREGSGVAKLVAANRDASKLTLASAVQSMFEQYEKIYDKLKAYEDVYYGVGNGTLGYRPGYATHVYGRGFLGSVDSNLRESVVRELGEALGAEYKRREKDYARSYQITMDYGDKAGRRSIMDATPRMIHTLFGLLDIDYTDHAAAVDTIKSGELEDKYGINASTSYEDTAFRIHEEAMRHAQLIKAKGTKLRGYSMERADIDDMASFINYMQAQFKTAKRREYSGRTKPAYYPTFENAFAEAGLLPDSVTAFDALSRYANDIVVKTARRVLLNQVAMMLSTDGQQLIIPEPDTRVADDDTDQLLDPGTWRQVLRVASARYAVQTPEATGVKDALKRVIEHVQDDPNYKILETPHLASINRIYVLGGAKTGDNVLDVLATRGGGTIMGLLQQVVELPYHDAYGVMEALEKLNSFAKKMNLFGSLFFHKAAFESLTAGTGGKFSLFNAKKKFKVPELDNGASWVELAQAYHRGDPWIETLIELAAESGVQMVGTSSILGIPERLAATDKAKITAWLTKAFDKNVANRVKHLLLDLPDRNTSFTFDTVFATSKLALMLHTLEFEEQKHAEAGLPWTHADQVKALSGWAQYINGEMGGPEAAQYSWYTPRVKQFSNLLWFSFPWTFSAWNAAGGGLITGRFLGNQPTAKETEHILSRRWPAMIALVMMAEPMVAQLVAWAFGKVSGDDDEKMKPLTIQNERGKRMHADITPILRKQPWFDNGAGRRYYMRWGKQGYEILRWLQDPIKALAGKTSPIVHAAFELATGHVLGHPEWGLGFQDAGLAGILLSPEEGFWGSRAGYVVQKFVPFSALAWTRDKNKAAVSWLGPVSAGASWHSSVTKLSEVLNTWAARRTYTQLYNNPRFKANLEALGKHVMDAAERNGLDPDKVLSSASGNVLKDYYAKFYKALNANDTRTMEYTAREIMRLNGAANSMIRSAKTRKQIVNEKLSPELRTAIRDSFKTP
jgi:hypothetical protein